MLSSIGKSPKNFSFEVENIVNRSTDQSVQNNEEKLNSIGIAYAQENQDSDLYSWMDDDDLPEGPKPLRWGKVLQFPTSIPVEDEAFIKQLLETVRYKRMIEEGAKQFGFQTSIICAMGSQASGWGLILHPAGPAGRSSDGMGHGLMQIDIRRDKFARVGAWDDPEENILYACSKLSKSFDGMRQSTQLKSRLLLRAALVAFNVGLDVALETVEREIDIDCFTDTQDYSADIINRAGWFQLHGWI